MHIWQKVIQRWYCFNVRASAHFRIKTGSVGFEIHLDNSTKVQSCWRSWWATKPGALMEEQLDRHLLRIIHAAAETIQTCRYGETIQIKRDLYTIMNLEQSKSTSKQQSKHERFQLFHKSCKSLKFTFFLIFSTCRRWLHSTNGERNNANAQFMMQILMVDLF